MFFRGWLVGWWWLVGGGWWWFVGCVCVYRGVCVCKGCGVVVVVFQGCACGEYISMGEDDWTRGLLCWCVWLCIHVKFPKCSVSRRVKRVACVCELPVKDAEIVNGELKRVCNCVQDLSWTSFAR